MNEKGKEWIKKNWTKPTIHIFVLTIYITVVYFMIQIGLEGVDNNASMDWNIFVAIFTFGGLCFITLFCIYIEKWSDRMYIYLKEYNEYIKEK